MILPLVVLTGLAQSPIKAQLDQSLAAHRNMKAASIAVVSEALVGSRRQTFRYHVAYVKPDKMSLRMILPDSDRTYYFMGSNVIAYDARDNEFLSRVSPPKTTLLERAALLFSGLDDAVQTIVDTRVMFGFYGRLMDTKGWRRSVSGGQVTLSMTAGKGKRIAAATLSFDARRHLLRQVRLKSPTGVITWSYTYSAPPKTISFTPPQTAIKVESFLQAAAPPRYVDGKARAKVEACSRAYDQLRHFELTTRSGNDKSRIWFSNHRLRENQARVEWSYADGVLSIKDLRKKVLYKGKIAYSATPQQLQKLGVQMDPLIRQLITRNNPIRRLLDPKAKVRFVGNLAAGGQSHDLIEVLLPEVKSTVWIRTGDKLISRIETRNLDRKGSVIFSSTRDIDYVKVGRPLAASVFRFKGVSKPLEQIKR